MPAQALGLAEAQPVAVVQSVPGAHPVPLYAFSIKGSSYSEVSLYPAPASLRRPTFHQDSELEPG